jgi:DNA mismatch repair protein MutS2
MAMDTNTLTVLEYPKILALLSDFASTGSGSAACALLTPMKDREDISRTLDTVTEVREITAVEGVIPFGGVSDISSLVDRTKVEGAYLSAAEIWDIGLNISAHRKIKAFLSGLSDRYPLSSAFVEPIISLPDLEETIERSISPKGDILDGASERLGRIRKEIKKKKQELNRTLSSLLTSSELIDALQEELITIRNGRYVIPVKAEQKGKVSGIVHDRSQSGATLFIEPLSTMDANNELLSLLKEEEDEEIRVLHQLTDRIREVIDDIVANHKIVVELDTLLARARMADAMGAVAPEISDRRELRFLDARHPLLAHEKKEKGNHTFGDPSVVPIHLEIGGDVRMLILSGANTGGKTAALKTLGLLSLMFMTGMPIPVSEGSTAVPYKKVFADIGDEQDIEGRLSTFSAKLERLKKILTEVDEDSLILVDEIMTGTDPLQGSALAITSLSYLSKKNATILVTTHLNNVKAYAVNHPHARNVSVTFDETNNRPLYKLTYGIPGGSNALIIAKNIGIPETIIDDALVYIGEEGEQLGILISELESERISVMNERKTVGEIKKRIVLLENELKGLIRAIQEKRNEIFEAFRASITRTIQEYEARFKDIFARMDREGVKVGKLHGEFYETKRVFADALPETAPDAPPLEEISVGDYVSIRGSAPTGIVRALTKERAEVEVDGRRILVATSELVRVAESTKERHAESIDTFSEPKIEINVIGLTVEDALPTVDKAIDNALLGGLMSLTVIHGMGTGKLKKAIRKHLERHQHVKAVKTEFANDGITTAELL